MLKDFNPLVTVLIPVYNGADYLGVAVESALAQRYGHIEVVVVNDGSTDDGATARVARSFGDRIRYCEKENGGVASALNHGLEQARGDYISWLSHDDFYDPDKIATQIDYLRLAEDPDLLTFTAIRLVGPQGERLRDHIVPPRLLRDVVLTILSTSVNGCATLVPQSAFAKAGRFDERLKTVQDNDLWLRMALAGVPFAYLSQPLVASRQHPGQTSNLLRDTHFQEKELFYLKAIRSLGSRFPPLAADIVAILEEKGLHDVARAALARARQGGL